MHELTLNAKQFWFSRKRSVGKGLLLSGHAISTSEVALKLALPVKAEALADVFLQNISQVFLLDGDQLIHHYANLQQDFAVLLNVFYFSSLILPRHFEPALNALGTLHQHHR